MNLVLYRNSFAVSNTGGIRETQDMIDFCALNKIKPEIEKISMNGIDDARANVFEKKALYRYVVDMKA
jgi:alcohol dehydrogenase (NADP+)